LQVLLLLLLLLLLGVTFQLKCAGSHKLPGALLSHTKAVLACYMQEVVLQLGQVARKLPHTWPAALSAA
jgi:hypothetical protein